MWARPQSSRATGAHGGAAAILGVRATASVCCAPIKGEAKPSCTACPSPRALTVAPSLVQHSVAAGVVRHGFLRR
jgi:hypothetical protein